MQMKQQEGAAEEQKGGIMIAFRQFIRFGIVGVSNTVLSYIIYVGCLKFFEMQHLFARTDYVISSVISFLISVFWSYYWNNHFTFKDSIDGEEWFRWDKLLKTYSSYAFTGLLLANVMLIAEVRLLGISKVIAPIVNLCITVPVNFLLNKFWVFKKIDG